MPTLQVTIWSAAAEVALGVIELEEIITISGTSAVNATPCPGFRKIKRMRLYSDTDCWVHWGSGTPVAKADGTQGRMLSADSPEYFSIRSGEKVAVIERT